MNYHYKILLICITVFCFSCSNSKKNKTTFSNGKEVFLSRCSICHGEDGKKGLGGASDLTISNLDSVAFFQIINNGRRGMPSFKNTITNKEKDFLFRYLKELKKN